MCDFSFEKHKAVRLKKYLQPNEKQKQKTKRKKIITWKQNGEKCVTDDGSGGGGRSGGAMNSVCVCVFVFLLLVWVCHLNGVRVWCDMIMLFAVLVDSFCCN